MKMLLTAISASFFSLTVSAADVYQELGHGNPDLPMKRAMADEYVGTRPGVGDSFDRYHGLADGHPDLFKRSSPIEMDSNAGTSENVKPYVGPGVRF